MRGATHAVAFHGVVVGHFNPRAPCGARRSSPATRTGTAHFNPRAPCGARLERAREKVLADGISIHAPHAGRDQDGAGGERCPEDFNPRAPCGARRSSPATRTGTAHFNPRAPCGARRCSSGIFLIRELFQSTRPMRGATSRSFRRKDRALYFNPRAPCGARQPCILQGCCATLFQSTRPMRGATSDL